LRSLADVISDVIKSISNYDYVKRLLKTYKEILLNESKSKGKVIKVRDVHTYTIIGDIHGDMDTLRTILSKISIEELRKGNIALIFLGDYVDRGPYQLEVLMSVLALKDYSPDNVVLLRGNHEPPRDLIPYPHDFPDELVMRYGYDKGLNLYNEFMDMFEFLPHVAYTKEGIVLLHGGLPTTTYQRAHTIYEYFTGISDEDRFKVIEEVLWNDPIEANIASTSSPRGAGYLFGTKVTEWFTKKFKFKLIVRGHEPVGKGYKFNHGGKVLTLFSRLGPPYFNSQAAYLVLRVDIRNWENNVESFIKLIQGE